MKVHNLTPPPRRHVVTAITFDPWPFSQSDIDLADFVGYFDGEEIWYECGYLLGGRDNTLAALSDGSIVVLAESNVLALAKFLADESAK